MRRPLPLPCQPYFRELHKRALRQAEQQLEDQKEAYARSRHLIADSAPRGAYDAEREGLRREVEDLRRQVKAVPSVGAAGGGSSTAQPRRGQTEPGKLICTGCSRVVISWARTPSKYQNFTVPPFRPCLSDEVYALRLRLEASQNELQAAATVVAERDQLLDQAKSWEGLFSAELVPRGGLHEGAQVRESLPAMMLPPRVFLH